MNSGVVNSVFLTTLPNNLNNLYKKYINTYKNTNNGVWNAVTPEFLIQHYPFIIFERGKNQKIKYALMLQKKRAGFKVSVAIQNGTETGKKAMLNTLKSYLKRPGFFIEASGKLSWVLRKNETIPIIMNKNIISTTLNVQPTAIIMKNNYNKSKQQNQVYHRVRGRFVKPETLFGTPLIQVKIPKQTQDTLHKQPKGKAFVPSRLRK